ncbi:MAG: AsmA family protein, partial [Rhodospirillales bacterium]|nr:AsmA family protein [Rhodospirillales bacterium]
DRADLTGVLAAGLPAGLGAHWPGGLALHLRVGQAGLGRLQLHDLDLQARAGPEGLALDRLRATLGAARLAAAVQLAPDGAVQALALRLHAARAGDLRALAPAWFTPAPGFWQAPAAASLTASGPVQALSLRLALMAGGAQLDLAPVLDLSRGLSRWRAQGTLMLRHPGIGRFLAVLGLGGAVAPGWPGAGSLSLAGQIQAAPDSVALAPFQISAGLLHASGALHLALAGGALPELTGQIDADSLPVPLPAEDSVLPLALLHGWAARLAVRVGRVVDGFRPLAEDGSATLRQQDGRLTLDDLHLRLAGGTIGGALRLDGAATPPSAALHLTWQNLALSGPLLAGDAPLDLRGGTVDGHAVLASAGYSLAAMRAGLAGRVVLHAADGAVSGFDLAALGAVLGADRSAHPAADPRRMRAALRGGHSDFTSLDGAARIAHGVVRIDHLAMTGPAGQARLSGTFALLPPLADLALAMQPNGAAAPVIQRLTGPPGAMQRADGLDAGLAGR